jgi:predicted nucleotidyltransferase
MFEAILERIGECLVRHRIPYMIIGGQAVLLYGEPRLTRDIDITLGVNVDRFSDVLAVTTDLSLKVLPDRPESFVQKTMVLPAVETSSGIRVDFIFSMTSYEKEAIQRAKKIQILGQQVSFASPEDLIIHKIFAGRPRDLEDVRSVLIRNEGLDVRHIRKWLKEFEISSEKIDLLTSFEQILTESRA